MSDQALREAFAAELRRHGVDEFHEVRGIADALARVAAHPVEPAPVVTELAVEAVARVEYGIGWDEETPGVQSVCRDMARKALQAAAPLLGPRPLVDREAVYDAIISHEDGEAATDAVMELARPMPARDQLARALDPDAFDETQREWVNIVRAERRAKAWAGADAVLALLNGAES